MGTETKLRSHTQNFWNIQKKVKTILLQVKMVVSALSWYKCYISCASYNFHQFDIKATERKKNLTFKKMRHNSCHQIIMKINSFYSVLIRYNSKDVYENFSLGDFFHNAEELLE